MSGITPLPSLRLRRKCRDSRRGTASPVSKTSECHTTITISSHPKKGISNLELDIKRAIQGQCVKLSQLQQSSPGAVQEALHYLQLREEGCSQAHAINLTTKSHHNKTERRPAPRFSMYEEKDDFINYEDIEAAYLRFEQKNVVIDGMVHSRDPGNHRMGSLPESINPKLPALIHLARTPSPRLVPLSPISGTTKRTGSKQHLH